MAILAARQLIEDQLAKHFSLASQHELFRVRLRSFKKTEFRIGDDADALERHQRAHDVGEVCRQTEWILINHFGKIISQLFKLDLTEFEIQINFKEFFDNRPHSLGINAGLEEVEIDNVLSQAMHVAGDHVKEGVNHLRLQFGSDATDHAKVEECKMSGIQHQQISGMRIGMEKTIFQ